MGACASQNEGSIIAIALDSSRWRMQWHWLRLAFRPARGTENLVILTSGVLLTVLMSATATSKPGRHQRTNSK
jgi:hypothetical protein